MLLERRVIVLGLVNGMNLVELKFLIDKKNVLCLEDFIMYKCKMLGYYYIISFNDRVYDED